MDNKEFVDQSNPEDFFVKMLDFDSNEMKENNVKISKKNELLLSDNLLKKIEKIKNIPKKSKSLQIFLY
jgi:hypothetical protein